MSRAFPCAFAVALAAVPAPALAEDSADAGLGAIVITANRADAWAAGGSVQRLELDDLRLLDAADAHRVLRAVPGVVLQEEDGFGLRPNIGIRGSGSDRSARVAVMEDGILVAPAPYAAPAAYYFPRLARITAVEVAKGPAAIVYGPLTVGGAIQLTASPIPEGGALGGLGGRATLLAGSFEGARAHAVLGGWAGVGTGIEAGAMLEGLYERSGGFKRIDGVGRDSGFDIRDMVARLGLRSTDAVHELGLKFQRYREGSDETYLGLSRADFEADSRRRYASSQRDRMEVSQDLWQLSWGFRPSPGLELAATAYTRDTARSWYKLQDVRNAANTGWTSLSGVLLNPGANPLSFADLTGPDSRPGALRLRDNNRAYEARGVQALAALGFATGPATHWLELSARYHEDSEDRFQQDDRWTLVGNAMRLFAAGAPGSQDNRLGEARAWAFFARDTIDLGALTLTPGVRYETIRLVQTRWSDAARTTVSAVSRDTVDVWIPGVGASMQAAPGVALVGGVHRGFRNPAPGSTARAETSWNWEAGVKLGEPDAGVEAIAFVNDYGNLVGTCTASTGGGCNIGDEFDGGAARAQGLEVSGRWAWSLGAARLPVSLAYTLLDTKFRSSFVSAYGPWGTVIEGDRFPYAPRHQLTAGAGLMGQGWQANLQAHWQSAQRDVASQGPIDAARRIGPRLVVDGAAELEVIPGIGAFVQVQNLFDRDYLASIRPSGLRPGLPRAVMAGLRFLY